MTDLPAGPPDDTTPAEATAQAFHEAYERLAPSFSYKTREASAVPWADVPEENKRLMIAVAAEVAPLIAVRAAAAERKACIEQIRGLRTHPTWQTDRWAYQAVIDLLAAAPEDTP